MKKINIFTLTLLVLSTISLQTAFAQDTLEGHTGSVLSVSFSPDGTTLASGSGDGTVKLWDVETHTNIATLEAHERSVLSVSFSPDGTTLASGSGDGTVKLWDVASHENITTLQGHTYAVNSASFSPDGTTLASGSDDDTVKLWDVASHENIATLQGHTYAVNSVSFSPDGATLASGSDDGRVKLWDVASHENIATLQGHTYAVNSVSFSPDGTLLASGGQGRSFDENIKLWDVETRTNIATLTVNRIEDAVYSVSFSPDGTLLASGGKIFFDREVRLWDVATRTNIATLDVGADVTSVSFSPDGTLLASGSADATVKLWNLAELTSSLVKISGDEQHGIIGTPLANPLVVEVRNRGNNPLPNAQVTFKVSEGGGLLSGESKVVEVTTDANGRAAQTLTLGTKPGTNSVKVSIGNELVTFNAVGISPYKLEIISGNFQQGKFNTALEEPLVVEARDWQGNILPNAQVTFEVSRGDALLNGQSSVVEVTTDANGRAAQTLVLGNSIHNTVEVSIGHDLVEFNALGNSSSHSNTLSAGFEEGITITAFSPDGKTLAFSSTDTYAVELWDVDTHTSKASFEGHMELVVSVAFSPDGTLLATGSADDTVKLWDVEAQANIATFEEHTDTVWSVAFSPDGTLLATGAWNGVVKVWDVETKQNIATFGGHDTDVLEGWLGGWFTPITFSPDGTTLVYGAAEDINFWDVETKQNIATIEAHPEGLSTLSFSTDGTRLVSSSGEGIKLWDVETRESIPTSIPASNDGILSTAFFPNDTILAFNLLRLVILWDVVQDTPIAILEGHTDNVWSISFSPDGSLLASSSSDGIVKLWNTAEAKSPQPAKLAKISGEAQQGWMGILLPNPLVVEVRDQYNNLYPGGQVEFSVTEGGGKLNGQSVVERVTADADGRAMISLTLGHTLVNTVEATPLGGSLAWNQSVAFTITISPYIFSSLQAHSEAVYDLSLSLDGKTLATGSSDNTVKLWDMETQANIGTLEGHLNYINVVSFSPDGMRLASCSGDNTVRLWDMETHTEIATLGGHERSVLGVAFSPDGTRLASGGRGELNDADGQVKLWEVETQTNIATLEGHTGLVWSVAFSSDGKTLATASSDATVKVWDVETQTNIATLEGHEDSVLSVAFSLDGKTLATGSSDNTVKLWDVATRTNIATLEGHTGTVWSVAFSSDGKTLASGSLDTTVKLWDVDTHTNIVTLEEHTDTVWSVAISPDGKTLISGSGDGTVKLWDMSSVITSPLTPTSLAADVNGDGVVNMADLVLVASNYGQTGEHAADVNGDGVVHIYDILLVAAQINTNAAAPSPHAKDLSMVTTADVKKWLSETQYLKLIDATSQRGIRFLEQLLAALTPKETTLLPNYPNPFNPETWIPYRLAKDAFVTLTIYDGSGRVVRTLDVGYQSAAFYESRSKAIHWDGRNEVGEGVASGVYFYHLSAGDFSATRKMLIIK